MGGFPWRHFPYQTLSRCVFLVLPVSLLVGFPDVSLSHSFTHPLPKKTAYKAKPERLATQAPALCSGQRRVAYLASLNHLRLYED